MRDVLGEEQKSFASAIDEARMLRMATAFVVAILVALLLNPGTAGLWLCFVLAAEVWQWRCGRALSGAEIETGAQKLRFITAYGCNTMAWSAVGDLIWSVNGGLCQGIALSVWATQLMLAGHFSLFSRTSYKIGTLPPLIAVGLVIAPWLPHLSYTHSLTLAGVALAFAFSLVTARQAASQRQRQIAAAKSSLEASETRFRTLANSVTDVIIQLAPDGRRLYTSPSIKDLLGYTPEDYLIRARGGQVSEEDRDLVMDVWAQVRDDGKPRSVQCRAICADGAVKWLESSYAAVNHDDGPGPYEVVVVMRDIGARKAIEEQLAKAARDAAAAAAAKSEFLANMSHELRTPLTAILGFSDLLKSSTTLTPADARSADRINTASRTLMTVVNDILDFSKMEAGALDLDSHPVDLIALLQDTLDLIAEEAASKGVGVRLETVGVPSLVVGDPVRLRQILLNLCSNAVKFTSAGEIVGRLEFAVPTEGALAIRIAIRDTGIGMEDDQRRRVFDRFSQADGSISRRYGGTGLGLAICKRLVTLMGGAIDVDSAPGHGSIFRLDVTLPIADRLEVSQNDGPLLRPDVNGAKLLVAEDHPANQELIGLILQAAGHDVHLVCDGAQAVEAFQTERFDLILMDVQMPVMDGPEATRRIRALERPTDQRTPIIAMTANVMSDQISAYIQAGMDAHVGKPINTRELLQTILAWTDRGPDLLSAPARSQSA